MATSEPRKRAKGKMTPKRLEVAERHARAVELRRENWTLDEIKDELGYGSRASVHRAIEAEMRRTLTEPAEQLVLTESNRLDTLIESHWEDATGSVLDAGDYDDTMDYEDNKRNLYREWDKASERKFKATDMVLKGMAQKAKLRGLNDYEKRMADVAERRQALDEAQARLVAGAVMAILGRLDLTEEQRALAATVAPEELRAIGS